MTPAEAAQILQVTPDASPEQVETAYQALRQKLEDRIAKAPTPGLKAKYRESLEAITQAHETLTHAADSSDLPVLKKEGVVRSPLAGGPDSARPQGPPAPSAVPTKPKSGGKEFILVAVIAVIVLAVGGWWVLKTRAENAEKARLAAEQKAEADHQAELARQAAEAKRLAEQQEKERIAAEAKAAQERLDKLAADVRVKLAEIRIAWEAHDQKQKMQERKVGDLKADERSLANQLKGAASPDLLKLRAELAAEEEFTAWLASTLLRHPARIARVQAEELLNAKQIEEALSAATRAQDELAKLDADIAANAKSMLTLTGSVRIDAKPDTTRWIMTDAYGNTRHGYGPAQLEGIPFGRIRVTFSLPDFDEREATVVLRRDQPLVVQNEFTVPPATLETIPGGAEIWIDGQKIGVTPATFALPGEGAKTAELRLPGFPTRRVALSLADRRSLKQKIDLNDLSYLTTEQLRDAYLAAEHWMHTLPMFKDNLENSLAAEQGMRKMAVSTFPRSVWETFYRNVVPVMSLFEARYGPPAAGTSGSEGSDYYSGLATEQIWQRLRAAADAMREAYGAKDPSRLAEQDKAMARIWEELKNAPRPELEKRLSAMEYLGVSTENRALQARLAARPRETSGASAPPAASTTAAENPYVKAADDKAAAERPDLAALPDDQLRKRLRDVLRQARLLPQVLANAAMLNSISSVEAIIDSLPRSSLIRILNANEKAVARLQSSSPPANSR